MSFKPKFLDEYAAYDPDMVCAMIQILTANSIEVCPCGETKDNHDNCPFG